MKNYIIALVVGVMASSALLGVGQADAATYYKNKTICSSYKTNVNGKVCFKLYYYKRSISGTVKYKPHAVYVYWTSWYSSQGLEPGGSVHKLTNPKVYTPLKSGEKVIWWKTWKYNYSYNISSLTKYSKRSWIQFKGGIDGPQWMNDDYNVTMIMN